MPRMFFAFAHTAHMAHTAHTAHTHASFKLWTVAYLSCYTYIPFVVVFPLIIADSCPVATLGEEKHKNDPISNTLYI